MKHKMQWKKYISSTAVTNVAHSKLFSILLFSIFLCNIRGTSSNLSSVHQHLHSSNPQALYVNDNSILSPHLKCPGYETFLLFFLMVVFVHPSALMYKVLFFLNLTSKILVFNSSGRKFHLHALPLAKLN